MRTRQGSRGFSKVSGIMVPIAVVGTVMIGAQSWRTLQPMVTTGLPAGRLEQNLAMIEAQMAERFEATLALQSEAESLNRELSRLREENLDLRKELGAAQLQAYELGEQVVGSRGAQGAGRGSVRDRLMGDEELRQQMEQLQQRYDQAQARVEEVGRSNAQLQRQLNEAMASLQAQQTERRALEGSVVAANASAADVAARLEQVRADLAMAQQRLGERETELARLRSAPGGAGSGTLRLRPGDAATRERELLAMLRDRDTQINTLTQQLNQAASEGQARGGLVQQTAEEIQQLQRQAGELTAQMQQQVATIDQMTDETIEKDLLLEQLTRERDLLHQQLTDVMAQAGTHQSEAEELATEISALRATIEQREEERGRRSTQVLSLQDEVAAAARAREALQAQVTQLQVEAEMSAQTIGGLKGEAAQARQALEEAKAELVVVRAQLAQTETVRDGLKRQAEVAQQAQREATEHLANISSMQASFQEQLAQLMRTFSAGDRATAAGAPSGGAAPESQHRALALGEEVQRLLGVNEPLAAQQEE